MICRLMTILSERATFIKIVTLVAFLPLLTIEEGLTRRLFNLNHLLPQTPNFYKSNV